MIEVIINGEIRRFDQALNLAEVLEQIGLAGRKVALERNGEIVPRGSFAVERLREGDRLEIVAAVGGG